jgi:hypothetical protein
MQLFSGALDTPGRGLWCFLRALHISGVSPFTSKCAALTWGCGFRVRALPLFLQPWRTRGRPDLCPGPHPLWTVERSVPGLGRGLPWVPVLAENPARTAWTLGVTATAGTPSFLPIPSHCLDAAPLRPAVGAALYSLPSAVAPATRVGGGKGEMTHLVGTPSQQNL